MRGVLDEKNLQAKEAYERLEATQVTRVCGYMAYNNKNSGTLFREAFHTCVQHISYCGVVSHHQNLIV